jgi:MoaA/NifB/PqqE/SkfB family radical SAM enzyme
MDCGFCFSYWREGLKELSTKEAKTIIKFLKEQGLEAINFTGGEPLLRKDIVELIKYSKKLGLSTILTTNGILLKEKIGALAKYLDFIGLPLDSIKPDIHNAMRVTAATRNHQGLVVKLINEISRKYPKIGIKINTIVTKKNKSSLIALGSLLDGKVVSWKLSQFIPGAVGKLHQSDYQITQADFLKVADQCKKKFPKINIIAAVAHSRDSGCRILSTAGHLLKPVGNKLKDLGDIFSVLSKKDDPGFNEKLNNYFYNKTYPVFKNKK